MSKELIERLRADAESTDDIGLCADAADRIEELERDLLNLVCRIHRDGGHYIAKHGEAKAIADADIVATQNNADLDALQADRDEWKARAEFSYRQRDELNRLCEFNEKTMSTLQADNAQLQDEVAELVEDKGRLDFLDGNSKFKMGWSVGQSPVGNLSISAVIQLGKEPTTIREAIDTALAKVRKP